MAVFLAGSFFEADINKLINRYNKCPNNGENYVETFCKVMDLSWKHKIFF